MESFSFEDLGTGSCKMIHNKAKMYALIDSNIKESLIKWMRENGTFSWDSGCFRQSSRDRYRLIEVLAGLYNHVDVEEINRLHHVYPKNGDLCDCRRSNISFVNGWEAEDCKLLHDSIYNAVYDYGINVLLLCKEDGVMVHLDACNAIRTLLINLIKTGHIIRKLPRAQHVMVYDLADDKQPLAQHIIANMYGMPMIGTGTIIYADGNPLNITINNIIANAAPANNTPNRTIRSGGDRVYLWASDGYPHYTDGRDKTASILKLPIWSWHDRADGRLAADVRKHGKTAGIPEPYLYQLRWAVEHYGATDDYFVLANSLRKMQQDFAERNLNIDHLDSNYRNNCIWNLALMTRSQNRIKHNLTARIYNPYYWFSVNAGTGYRILCGAIHDDPMWVYCETSEEYISVLRWFWECEIGDAPSPSQIGGGNRIGYDTNGNLTHAGDKIIQHLLHAEDAIFGQREKQLEHASAIITLPRLPRITSTQ